MRVFKNVLVFAVFLLMTVAAQAAPLTIVNVSAPAINCVFNPLCTVTPTDTSGMFTLSGDSGTAQLHSRTYLSASNAPAAGKWIYDYRVDLTQMSSTGSSSTSCVSKLILDFGPVTKLSYVQSGTFADVFVITHGGHVTIGLSSAVQSGNSITFTFSTPVCPGIHTPTMASSGQSSFVFGLAAATAPKPSMAHLVFGSGVGGGSVNAAARVPMH